MNPSELKTATIFHIDHSKFKPDFFAKEIPWQWVIFPWNKHEDLVNLVGKIAGSNSAEVQKEFKKRHGVEIELEDIERAMNTH
jgi:hypoxanthine phosphoribosyltransferase